MVDAMNNDNEPVGRKVLTVAELTRDIKAVLESGFTGFWVEGEISAYKVYPSGHAYFTLKDESAQIRAVIWKGYRGHIKFEPDHGDQVVCRGRVSVYEKRGEYQLTVESMEPKGLGALQAAYEKLKKQLATEGLFDDELKKPLPYIPWSIGIVTSPKGAVAHDMIRTIWRRFPGIRIVLNPVPVQGEGAAAQIANAIEEFNEYGKVDVIIVGRGGGSLEDLWAFNEEIVARAIAASKLPIVSAVGHETDFTIADFVADLRASTPTAAAEQIAPERLAVEEYLDDQLNKISTTLRDIIETGARQIDDCTERSRRGVRSVTEIFRNRLAGVARHLGALSPKNQFQMRQKTFHDLQARLRRAILMNVEAGRARLATPNTKLLSLRLEQWVAQRRTDVGRISGELGDRLKANLLQLQNRLESGAGKLEAYNPHNVLQRGYSIITDSSGKRVIKSAGQLKAGDMVRLRLRDGEKNAQIKSDDHGQQQKLL